MVAVRQFVSVSSTRWSSDLTLYAFGRLTVDYSTWANWTVDLSGERTYQISDVK